MPALGFFRARFFAANFFEADLFRIGGAGIDTVLGRPVATSFSRRDRQELHDILEARDRARARAVKLKKRKLRKRAGTILDDADQAIDVAALFNLRGAQALIDALNAFAAAEREAEVLREMEFLVHRMALLREEIARLQDDEEAAMLLLMHH